MIGKDQSIRFVAKLQNSRECEVLSKFDAEKGITLSLRASGLELERAARREMWHFANKNFLLYNEKLQIRAAFHNRSALNFEVQSILQAMGAIDAVEQCENEDECAAHAFALWCENRLDVTNQKATSVFDAILLLIDMILNWLEESIFGIRIPTAEDLFVALYSGELATRVHERIEAQAQDEKETVTVPPRTKTPKTSY